MFYKFHLAVFVDGCFWHSCPSHSTRPKSNSKFWIDKFQANKSGDILVNKTLKKKRWRVLRIWEHELIAKNEVKLVNKISRYLANQHRMDVD